MDRENKKNIPLSLIILFLIIIFFGVLIFSSSYFQSRLQGINYSELESGYELDEKRKAVTFGVDLKRDSVNYLTQLSISLSDALNTSAVIKQLTPEQCLRELESGDIDIAIIEGMNFERDNSAYNYSDNLLNSGYVIITKKPNKKLQSDVNFALNGMLINGRVWDLQQKYSIQ